MNKFHIFLLFLIPTSLFAQEKSLLLGLQFSADQINGENYVVSDGNINGYNMDRSEFNFKIGLTLSQSIAKRINLNSGLFYSNKDFSGTYNCATCDLIGDPLTIDINHRYLTVPVNLEYRILQGIVSPSVLIGLTNNFNVQQEAIEVNDYFLEGLLGFGLTFELTKMLSLTPRYSYSKSLTDVYRNENNSPNFKTNNFQVGIDYKIK